MTCSSSTRVRSCRSSRPACGRWIWGAGESSSPQASRTPSRSAPMMRIDVFTLTPHAYAWMTEQQPIAGVLGGELELRLFNYRDPTPFRAAQVDDTPYGGGAGTVLGVGGVGPAPAAGVGG